jgi:hypothetical protein
VLANRSLIALCFLCGMWSNPAKAVLFVSVVLLLIFAFCERTMCSAKRIPSEYTSATSSSSRCWFNAALGGSESRCCVTVALDRTRDKFRNTNEGTCRRHLSYGAGYKMQASLAAVSAALGFLAAWTSWDWRWIVGAVLILANWPFTLIGMMPINHKLKTTVETDAGPTSRAMLVSWGQLHAVRTVLGVTTTVAYLWALH